MLEKHSPEQHEEDVIAIESLQNSKMFFPLKNVPEKLVTEIKNLKESFGNLPRTPEMLKQMADLQARVMEARQSNVPTIKQKSLIVEAEISAPEKTIKINSDGTVDPSSLPESFLEKMRKTQKDQ